MTCYGYGYGYGPSLSVDPLAQSRASFAASRQQAAVADVHQEEENHKSTLAIAGTAALAAVAFAVFCPGKAKAIKDKVLGLFAKGKGAEAAVNGAGKGAGKGAERATRSAIPPKKWLSKFMSNGEYADIANATKVEEVILAAKNKGIIAGKDAAEVSKIEENLIKRFTYGKGTGFATEEQAVGRLKKEIAGMLYNRETNARTEATEAIRKAVRQFFNKEENKPIVSTIDKLAGNSGKAEDFIKFVDALNTELGKSGCTAQIHLSLPKGTKIDKLTPTELKEVLKRYSTQLRRQIYEITNASGSTVDSAKMKDIITSIALPKK